MIVESKDIVTWFFVVMIYLSSGCQYEETTRRQRLANNNMQTNHNSSCVHPPWTSSNRGMLAVMVSTTALSPNKIWSTFVLVRTCRASIPFFLVKHRWNIDCSAKNEIKPREPIRCRECGHRIMYKKRTRRSKFICSCISKTLCSMSVVVQFEAR